MNKLMRIAVDGPSGAGKSTIAKAVAKRLGIDYIDTGAMYRAIGYKMSVEGIDAGDTERLESMLKDTDIDFVRGDIILDGRVVSDVIRTPEMSRAASVCSALPAVRAKLVEIQRGMGAKKSVIMDGRDIGSNVLKDAEYKFFLTASPEERAQRRYEELVGKGEDVTFEQVLADIKERDHRDTTRKLNPLIKTEDAVEIDSTGLSIDEVTEKMIKEIR